MGGFFSPPSPPPMPQMAAPPPAIDPDAEERQRRLDAIGRNRRGRAGTIATGDRGVLEPVSPSKSAGSGKRLLGE